MDNYLFVESIFYNVSDEPSLILDTLLTVFYPSIFSPKSVGPRRQKEVKRGVVGSREMRSGMVTIKFESESPSFKEN